MIDDNVYPVGAPPAGRRPPYYLTAYGIACAHGFRGTEEEWLESMKVKGDPGKTAYEYAKEAGYAGNEESFAERMNTTGRTAYEYALEGGFQGTLAEFYLLLGSLDDPTPINRGGHGKTTAAEGLAALGGLAKKGGTMEGNLNMGSHRITGLAEPENDGDAAGKKFVETKVANLRSEMEAVTVTLNASGWSSGAPYTQTVAVSGMTSQWVPGEIKGVPGSSTQTNILMREQLGYICELESGNGTLKVTCYEEKPTISMTFRVAPMVT